MEIGILGALEVRAASKIRPLGGTKQRAVLAMLVLATNQVVSTDCLADGLWGDTLPASANNVIQTYISRLRGILAGADSIDADGRVRRCPPGYLLDMDPEHIDLFRFERLSRDGIQQLTTAPDAASTILRQALTSWRGQPLAEFAELPFAPPEIQRLKELRLGALVARIEADLRLGRHAELISELEVLVSSHPMHEELCAQLMTSLFRSGRQAEALAVFRRVRQTFAEELGIDPGRKLGELEAAILAQDRSLEWHPPRSGTEAGRGSLPAPDVDPTGPNSPAWPTLPAAGNGPSAVGAALVDRPDGRDEHGIWNVPARNPHFTGRADLLGQLHQRLRSGQHHLVVEALFGLGGVGKTQLAIEYAHRWATDYRIVWWIDAEQPVLIPDQLISLAVQLDLPTSGNTVDVLESVLLELAHRSSWLLIFDNAERPDHIARYRPGGTGHVMVTSRFPGWGAMGGRLQVDVLTRVETVALLQARIPQMDSNLTDDLAAELGDLPLAAAQAAAYLEQTGLAPAAYLRRFRTRRAGLLGHGDVVGYQRRVDTAWDLSLERLSKISPVAVELLELGAFLAPEPIPLQLFTEHPWLLSGALRATAWAGVDELADAVGAAVAFSLVSRHQDTFQLHRLVQAVVRHRLKPARQSEIVSVLLGLLTTSHPGDPSAPAAWPAYARLAPHVLATSEFGDDDPAGRALMLDTLRYLNIRGDSSASRLIAEELLDRWRRDLGPSHPSTLDLATMLTFVLAWLGEADRALELGRDTLGRCGETLGPDHPTSLLCATYLTSALVWLGDGVQAAGLGQDTLQRCRISLGPRHPITLSSAAQFAFTLLTLGQMDPARILSAETVELSTDELGPAHPTTLLAATALTFALAWLGQGESASAIGGPTVERCQEALGLDNWRTLIAAAGQTFALVAAADNEKACEISLEIVDRSRRVLGADHWVTLLAAAARTFALIGVGDAAAAIVLGTDTVQRCGRALGDEHPITVSLVEQLAGVADQR